MGDDVPSVLVIDDDPSVLRYVTRCLTRSGFWVCAQNSGSAGIEAARRCLPDVIVCDVTMPGTDGHQVLQQIRSLPNAREIPFIFLTAKQERKDVRKGMQLGADDYLPKPFSIEELVDAVRSRLDRKWQMVEAASVRIRDMAQRIESNEAGHAGDSNRKRLLDLAAFDEALRTAAEASPPTDLPLAVYRWKDADRIYQRLGAAAVEDLQRQFGDRLQAVASQMPETLAFGRAGLQRLGVLFSGSAWDRAEAASQEILTELTKPYQVGGVELFIQFCAGLTRGVAQPNGLASARPAAVMLEAEAALRVARPLAGSRLVVYRPEAMALPAERLRLESDLHHAVERGQLRLHFQPQIDLTNNQIAGFEALVRWQHHELGMVSPAEFIPIAEQNGSIRAIGEWVLRESCRQMASWRRQGCDIRHIAVNLSAIQLDDGLAGLVRSALADAKLDPRFLQLEITETSVLEDLSRAQRILQELRDTGVTVAIDDFGVGYSSLGYLRQLKFDVLKIDRSFVHGIEREPEKLAICEMILHLAQALGFDVVAEGVETQLARETLQKHGCRYGQGYLFARPMPQEALTWAMWSAATDVDRIGGPASASSPSALTISSLTEAARLPVRSSTQLDRRTNFSAPRQQTA